MLISLLIAIQIARVIWQCESNAGIVYNLEEKNNNNNIKLINFNGQWLQMSDHRHVPTDTDDPDGVVVSKSRWKRV